jgi:hypothetical protein
MWEEARKTNTNHNSTKNKTNDGKTAVSCAVTRLSQADTGVSHEHVGSIFRVEVCRVRKPYR